MRVKKKRTINNSNPGTIFGVAIEYLFPFLNHTPYRAHPNWSGQPNATLTVGAAGRGLVGAGGELGLRPRGSRCALAI